MSTSLLLFLQLILCFAFLLPVSLSSFLHGSGSNKSRSLNSLLSSSSSQSPHESSSSSSMKDVIAAASASAATKNSHSRSGNFDDENHDNTPGSSITTWMTPPPPPPQRRRRHVLTAAFLTGSAAAAAAAGGGGTSFLAALQNLSQKSSSSSSFVSSSSIIAGGADDDTDDTTILIKTLPDIVQWIDQHCDRRFLSAVVASNFHFLYRGVADVVDQPTMHDTEVPDLLLPETYGTVQAATAVEYFQALEQDVFLPDDPIKPSLGHLATTSAVDAAVWGVAAASIWPSGSQSSSSCNTSATAPHYAWLEQGGAFDPSLPLPDRSQIIVDGKDCGRVNLEDALRMPASEIMFTADSFLAVPARMDQALRNSLQKAFLL